MPSFQADLVQRRILEMWFQALEFAVSCTLLQPSIFFAAVERPGGRQGLLVYIKIYMHTSPLVLSLAPTVEARQRTPFSLATPTETRSTRCLCYLHQLLLCSWKELRENNGAYSTINGAMYQHLKNCCSRLVLQQPKNYQVRTCLQFIKP